MNRRKIDGMKAGVELGCGAELLSQKYEWLTPLFVHWLALKASVRTDGSLKSESFVRCAFVVALGLPRRSSLSSQAVTPGHSPLLTSTSILHLRDSCRVHLPSV